MGRVYTNTFEFLNIYIRFCIANRINASAFRDLWACRPRNYSKTQRYSVSKPLPSTLDTRTFHPLKFMFVFASGYNELRLITLETNLLQTSFINGGNNYCSFNLCKCKYAFLASFLSENSIIFTHVHEARF